jgi:hypothetical protein
MHDIYSNESVCDWKHIQLMKYVILVVLVHIAITVIHGIVHQQV